MPRRKIRRRFTSNELACDVSDGSASLRTDGSPLSRGLLRLICDTKGASDSLCIVSFKRKKCKPCFKFVPGIFSTGGCTIFFSLTANLKGAFENSAMIRRLEHAPMVCHHPSAQQVLHGELFIALVIDQN